MQKSTDIKKLTIEAKTLFDELNKAEDSVEAGLDYAVDYAWRFGKQLNILKKAVGHGSWAKWREDTFPRLDDRRAQRCQALDSENPNASNQTHLSTASIRKYRHFYVPMKDRPGEKGDKTFDRPANFHVVVNEGDKLMRRVEAGHEKVTKEMLAELRPFFDWLSEFYRPPG